MKAKFIISILFYVFTFRIVYAQTLPSFIDTNGLVAWYSFNGNVDDISGKGNHGTIFGGATFQNDRFGKTNQAILFDGINDYVSIPRNSSVEPTNSITINAWITPVRMANVGWRTLLSKNVAIGFDPFISYSIQTSSAASINNKWGFYVSNGTAGSLKSLLATKALEDKDTLMITAVLGNGLMKLFINGQLDTSIAFVGNIGYADLDLLLGYNLNGPNEYYKGSIDELGIWNKALTSSQIANIYTNGGGILSSTISIANSNNRVNIYPNPANTELNFTLEQSGIYKAELTGISGSLTITTSGSSIDISALPAGIYVLKIFDTKNILISTNKIAIIK